MIRIRLFCLLRASAVLAAGLGFFFFAEGGLLNAAPAVTSDTRTSVASSQPGVTFLTKKARLWMGRSQVLCFKASALEKDHQFFFNTDPRYVQVLMPPSILPGESVGYIRLQPQMEGQTKITLDGSSLDVEIVRDTTETTLEQNRPEIISPAQNAVVWDSFVVGVERLDLAGTPNPPAPVLRLPGGQEITAHGVPDQNPGPHLRYAFTVDTQSLTPGMNSLVAVMRDASGHEISGEPININVMRPAATAIASGNCKDQINTPPPENPLVGPPPFFSEAQSGS